jgi:hypothetical protein
MREYDLGPLDLDPVPQELLLLAFERLRVVVAGFGELTRVLLDEAQDLGHRL